ncbi:MAG TPA: methionine synthase [Mycobacteriales bacterium]|nr:methionine synthase [Mycobacteriales bacterium]
MRTVLPAARATGVGSLPGTDPLEAARVVLGELPQLPHLPELPARGPHADLAGRGTAVLVDLPADLQPSGWRLVPRPSRDGRRARDLLERDLDALQEVAGGAVLPALKLQVAGPWTLAALVDLPRGERVLSDPGAVDDLAASLAEGVEAHLAAVRGRFPGTDLVLQVDEPLLPAVLGGQVPNASGAGRLRAPDERRATEVLARVLGERAGTVVHCCAGDVPVPLLRAAGVAAVSVDLSALPRTADQALGEAVEGGTRLLLGVVPSTDAPIGTEKDVLAPVVALWRRLGLDRAAVADAVTVTPTCGLAGATPAHARAALAACTAAGRRLDDLA